MEGLSCATAEDNSIRIFCLFSGVTVDGQYVNKPFEDAIHAELGVKGSNSPFAVPVVWDASHYLNLAVVDVRDGRKGFDASTEHLQRFIQRCNTFSHLFARGKNFAMLKSIAAKNGFHLNMPVIFAAQR